MARVAAGGSRSLASLRQRAPGLRAAARGGPAPVPPPARGVAAAGAPARPPPRPRCVPGGGRRSRPRRARGRYATPATPAAPGGAPGRPRLRRALRPRRTRGAVRRTTAVQTAAETPGQCSARESSKATMASGVQQRAARCPCDMLVQMRRVDMHEAAAPRLDPVGDHRGRGLHQCGQRLVERQIVRLEARRVSVEYDSVLRDVGVVRRRRVPEVADRELLTGPRYRPRKIALFPMNAPSSSRSPGCPSPCPDVSGTSRRAPGRTPEPPFDLAVRGGDERGRLTVGVVTEACETCDTESHPPAEWHRFSR